MWTPDVHEERIGPTEAAELEVVLAQIKARLEQERHRIYEEIKQYPPPIPACDQQFNYLLEQRAHIAQALQQLAALSQADLTHPARRAALAAFLQASSYRNGDSTDLISDF